MITPKFKQGDLVSVDYIEMDGILFSNPNPYFGEKIFSKKFEILGFKKGGYYRTTFGDKFIPYLDGCATLVKG